LLSGFCAKTGVLPKITGNIIKLAASPPIQATRFDDPCFINAFFRKFVIIITLCLLAEVELWFYAYSSSKNPYNWILQFSYLV
jgi:hypothetical protein